LVEQGPLYFDSAATTPVDPRVAELVSRMLVRDFGNPHSRTHSFGSTALKAVQVARQQVADVVSATPAEVVFTSGATESNNLAILGLQSSLMERGQTHIISSEIEHKAVIEPLELLQKRGFEVSWLKPDVNGVISPDDLQGALREETGLVSIMHVNNETGVVQPLEQMGEILKSHPAIFHTDAAQGYAKVPEELSSTRLDLISLSGHKMNAPKGVGALVVKLRKLERIPIEPLVVGGGQERGLRAGTISTPLVAALGLACELAVSEREERRSRCDQIKRGVEGMVHSLGGEILGDPTCRVPWIVNARFPGANAEALLIRLKDHVAIATGSACTSESFQSSHVLKAMGLPEKVSREHVRWSWGADSTEPDYDQLASLIRTLL
jgi:cysteine desulfurase